MALGAVLERLRSLPGGPKEIDGRWRGGKGEVRERSGKHLSLAMALGSAAVKYIIKKTYNYSKLDRNTAWASGPCE